MAETVFKTLSHLVRLADRATAQGIRLACGGHLTTPVAAQMCLVCETHRITVDPNQCGGRPCLRGLRIRVKDVLDLLAAGATPFSCKIH